MIRINKFKRVLQFFEAQKRKGKEKPAVTIDFIKSKNETFNYWRNWRNGTTAY